MEEAYITFYLGIKGREGEKGDYGTSERKRR